MYTVCVFMVEVHFALLVSGPRHGYEVKETHDAWLELLHEQVTPGQWHPVEDALAKSRRPTSR